MDISICSPTRPALASLPVNAGPRPSCILSTEEKTLPPHPRFKPTNQSRSVLGTKRKIGDLETPTNMPSDATIQERLVQKSEAGESILEHDDGASEIKVSIADCYHSHL